MRSAEDQEYTTFGTGGSKKEYDGISTRKRECMSLEKVGDCVPSVVV